MTEQELREKIISVLHKNFTEEVEVTPVYTREDGLEIELPQELCEMFNDIVTQAVIPYFADALIAAGLSFDKSHLKTFQVVDTKLRVAEHRAEVAEERLEKWQKFSVLALKNIIKYYLSVTGFCPIECPFSYCDCGGNNCLELLTENFMQQAEKESAEEKKDD